MLLQMQYCNKHALAANEALMAAEAKKKGTYKGEFDRYQCWLASQSGLNQNPKLLVENVETYFASEVANRKGKTKTVDKWVDAMQFFIDRESKGPHLPDGFWLRTNETVRAALLSHSAGRKCDR